MSGDSHLLQILLYAALPAGGNLVGVLLARTITPARWINGALLHGSAGIAIGLIATELMPRSLKSGPVWSIALAAFAGTFLSLALYRLGKRLSRLAGGSTGAWMVYATVAADLFSDGLIVGAGSVASARLGLFLAAGQLLANIPGGFAAGANLKSQDAGVWPQLAAGLIVSLSSFLAAGIGYLILRDTPDIGRGISLAAVMGLLLAATLEDLIPEADAPQPPRWSSTTALALGFAGIMMFSEVTQ